MNMALPKTEENMTNQSQKLNRVPSFLPHPPKFSSYWSAHQDSQPNFNLSIHIKLQILPIILISHPCCRTILPQI